MQNKQHIFGICLAIIIIFAITQTVLSQSTNLAEIEVTPEVIPEPPPQAPSNLRVITQAQRLLTIEWDDNSTSETAFEIQYMMSSGGWNTLTVTPANSTFLSIDDLFCGTPYSLRVLAYRNNDNTYSSSSNILDTETLACNPIQALTYFRVIDIEETSINLGWGDTLDETNYYLTKHVQNTYEEIILPVDTTRYLDTNVDCTQPLEYTLRAFRDSDGAFSDSVTVSISENFCIDLVAPTNFSAEFDETIDNIDSVFLSWNDVNITETGFIVERLMNDSWVEIARPTQTNYRETNPIHRSTSIYRVSAYRIGDVSQSPTATATVVIPSPRQSGITYTVTETTELASLICREDVCTLRAAVLATNDDSASNIIAFDLTGEPPYYIQPTTELPWVQDDTKIDATTLAQYAGSPLINLDGIHLSDVEDLAGITLDSAGAELRGFAINNWDIGVHILQTSTLAGNFIGVDTSGIVAQPNNVGIYAWTAYSDDYVTIGGADDVDRNVISGNRLGIYGNDMIIENNFIGVDATGLARLRNWSRNTDINIYEYLLFKDNVIADETSPLVPQNAGGLQIKTFATPSSSDFSFRIEGNNFNVGVDGTTVLVDGATTALFVEGATIDDMLALNERQHNAPTVNGFDPLAYVVPTYYINNVFYGRFDISIAGAVIQSNYFGLARTGEYFHSPEIGLSVNGTGIQVGGINPDEGNIFASNAQGGIYVNLYSVDTTIVGNQFMDNGLSGIRISSSVPAYYMQPLIHDATYDGISQVIRGQVSSTATAPDYIIESPFVIDIYRSPQCDILPSAIDYIGRTVTTTIIDGVAYFDVDLDNTIAPGEGISIIATDETGSSSVLSNCKIVQSANDLPVTDITHELVGETSVHLTWHNNSSYDALYLKRRVSGASEWQIYPLATSDTTQYTDTTAVCGTSYEYRVIAENILHEQLVSHPEQVIIPFCENNIITVNTTDMTVDGICDEIHCSLPEAFDMANNQLGLDEIHIPEGHYQNSLLSAEDDLILRGAGRDKTTLHGGVSINAAYRSLTISDLSITDSSSGIFAAVHTTLIVNHVRLNNLPTTSGIISQARRLIVTDTTMQNVERGIYADSHAEFVVIDRVSIQYPEIGGIVLRFFDYATINNTLVVGTEYPFTSGAIVAVGAGGLLHVTNSTILGYSNDSALYIYSAYAFFRNNLILTQAHRNTCMTSAYILSLGYNFSNAGSCGFNHPSDYVNETLALVDLVYENSNIPRHDSLIHGFIPLDECTWNHDYNQESDDTHNVFDVNGNYRPIDAPCDVGAINNSPDVNSDGRILPTDIIFIVNRLGASISYDTSRADVNGDGIIDQADIDFVVAQLP